MGWPQKGCIEVWLATIKNCRQLGTVEGAADLEPADVGSNTSFVVNGYVILAKLPHFSETRFPKLERGDDDVYGKGCSED